jgi:MOSC domain-containing protein YiiM
MTPLARIRHVNIARAAAMDIQGRSVLTAIGKRPVLGAVAVAPLGLAGDEQADLTVHGGLAKAVYAYPAEHLPFWQTVRAQARWRHRATRCRQGCWVRTSRSRA